MVGTPVTYPGSMVGTPVTYPGVYIGLTLHSPGVYIGLTLHNPGIPWWGGYTQGGDRVGIPLYMPPWYPR